LLSICQDKDDSNRRNLELCPRVFTGFVVLLDEIEIRAKIYYPLVREGYVDVVSKQISDFPQSAAFFVLCF